MLRMSNVLAYHVITQARDPNLHADVFIVQVNYAAGVVHRNIVQLLDVFAEGQRYVIVVRHTRP